MRYIATEKEKQELLNFYETYRSTEKKSISQLEREIKELEQKRLTRQIASMTLEQKSAMLRQIQWMEYAEHFRKKFGIGNKTYAERVKEKAD